MAILRKFILQCELTEQLKFQIYTSKKKSKYQNNTLTFVETAAKKGDSGLKSCWIILFLGSILQLRS